MDEKAVYAKDVIQLARLGLVGDRKNLETYIRRIMRQARNDDSRLADKLGELLVANPTQDAPLREAGGSFAPVDRDTRLQLVRHEDPVVLEYAPILASKVYEPLKLVVGEHNNKALLEKNNLSPSRTLLFTGRPGVGKTLSAKWLAHTLDLPLLTLDLSTVISSLLGRTGINLKYVLDYAKSVECVLLLDEFDAIAKQRGDNTELGELKRLVTVLLQEIDLWPSSSILVAATNHGELLDRAVWRRFDQVLEFPLPSNAELGSIIDLYFGEQSKELGKWKSHIVSISQGKSFSDIQRFAHRVLRKSLISDISIEDAVQSILSSEYADLGLQQRKAMAIKLKKEGMSDRKISSMLGIARDTLRKLEPETK
ncbi:AAA family ATPase [Methylobacterium sp. Leaf456]|uniref:AAA family ATPase n=1 Tax=Methylobacterium sp. Leaf456 TaxID=1736382 RepID=UPI000AE1086D|nr:AAA family ATPase [Methylobacterium sp. Leaf456]